MSKEFFHPETRVGEVFFTNSSQEDFNKMSWRTKRQGFTAYDGGGYRLNNQNWFPVFVQLKELIEAKVPLSQARQIFSQQLKQK